MRALLVWPEFPPTYWSGAYSLKFTGRKSVLPPLPLITVAAMLPGHWRPKVVDLNIEKLSDREIKKADVVLVSGMLVQRESLRGVLDRCRRLGVPTMVGGPYATSQPQLVDEATHVLVGEGEGMIQKLCADFEAGCAPHVVYGIDKPDVTTTPVPRYDLLKRNGYYNMSLQYSRGCPFSCEFCDIIVMFGRTPRTKTAEQVQAELDAILATGFRGSVFFVDDNFIGNKKAVRALMPVLRDWQVRHGWPFDFYTEASLNLAEDSALMTAMVEAGFTSVFIGIESPSAQALAETHKGQNIKGEIADRVHAVLRHGMDVWAGFIIGFDSDGPDIFDAQIELIEKAAIPYAMVGILSALPGTPLRARLEAAGRIKPLSRGDQFGQTNFATIMPEAELLEGYRRVLETVYEPRHYFDRVLKMMKLCPRPITYEKLTPRRLWWALRAVTTQALLSSYAREYRSFVRSLWRLDRSRLAEGLGRAAAGHHFIEYTRKVVVPHLSDVKETLAVRMAPQLVAQPEPAE